MKNIFSSSFRLYYYSYKSYWTIQKINIAQNIKSLTKTILISQIHPVKYSYTSCAAVF